MSLFVRKINRGKWEVGQEPAAVNADAITQCMKTQDNTLSVWKIDSKEQIGTSILAMAAANEHLSKIDVVLLSEEELRERKIIIEETPGQTPCKGLISTHRDLSQLNIQHLETISDLIAEQIRTEQIHSFSLGKLKIILGDAVKAGEVPLEELKESVREKVIKHLENEKK